MDIFLLQDFVISKALSPSINGVSIMEKFDDNNFLKTAVRNFVSFLSLVGGSDWDESFRQLVDWANGSGNSGTVLGPVAYTGRTRYFFAKTIFAGTINSITSSDLLDTIDCIRSRVGSKIEPIFTKWANDINGLSQLMEHHAMFNSRQEALSIDMSKVLRASPIKKPRKEDKPPSKKEDSKKKIEPKKVLPLQTLHNGKPKYCVFYTRSWLYCLRQLRQFDQ